MAPTLSRADYVKEMVESEAPNLASFKVPDLPFQPKFQLVQSATKLTTEELKACFNLIKTTSGDDYKASSIGWNPKQKKEEMRDKEMMYLLIRKGDVIGEACDKEPAQRDISGMNKTGAKPDTVAQSLAVEDEKSSQSNTNPIIGFISFMFTNDDPPHEDREVVYIYEVHLDTTLRGYGLGSSLVGFVEKVARRFDISKTMLTVFTSNKKAKALYGKLGYERDECSPEDLVMRTRTVEADYVIMSKELL